MTGARDDLVARDAAAFFHQHGSSPCIGALRAAGGCWIEDVTGHRMLDFHGNTAHHLGHAHPRIVAALTSQLEALPFCPRRFTNAPAVELAEALLARWPGSPARMLFAPGGSDAMEIALKLTRVATGRHVTVSLEGSYHGEGFGALGLGSARPDARLGPLLPGRRHVTPYWNDAARMLEELDRALAPGDVAAVVAEPMRSNCHVPPPGLWPEVRRLCNTRGTMLIFDEIPSGLGKTGRFFAFEHMGALPDAVVLGKALGGGVLPIAAVIADARLNLAPELALGHYTHEKNPMTCRAALETLRIIAEENLVARAAAMGGVMDAAMHRATGLRTRGLGLLRALPLPSDWAGAADEMVARLAPLGLSCTAKGPDAIGLSPPLIVTEVEIMLAGEALAQALGAGPPSWRSAGASARSAPA